MKNHTDVLIFHTAVCAGAPQTAVMADGKSPPRISRRPVAQSAPEWGFLWLRDEEAPEKSRARQRRLPCRR